MINFTKMHGIGNDYIYINCFENDIRNYKNLKEFVIEICDRHYAVGSDGVILVCPSKTADAKMIMYNADGSIGKMCGNGIRCVAKYVYDHNISKKNPLVIETDAGNKQIELIIRDDKVVFATVSMGKPILLCDEIPVIHNKKYFINEKINVLGKNYNATCISMGNPHVVILEKNIDNLNLEEIGPYFENNKIFPDRINTEFVEVLEKNVIKMRVWERGSGETLACGTGACASVVCATLLNKIDQYKEILVKLKGGDLYIRYDEDGNVLLKGEAKEVFNGEYKSKILRL